ncbi:aminotransferase class I/II-fold pyridoxal phosphate-dependent enzyme [Pelagovum pacificum]|uniref:Aminotransferase n=1 Tax=Pelagovum pacificum TaxID=2588711 RepID=A0A5C5GG72_9RHOB|nr:aminotransferase class I/II-fold pyridoxal phosphate-dependent enzyme [Pelagovum pacificum]QQA43089.1 aminotransferase class I/II-fold pyridoxal phosphate-dependent enzyme [Pelagovum pacificum]TNY33768.1 aminotransferase class I/II-fold pyridoxal phosphate-dependent enzyme [Pelagovum pacificum]
MKIEPFGVEQWMNAWETRCELNLAETCVHSLTLEELLQMAGRTQAMPSELAAMHLTYGPITGSERLRTLAAGLYDRQSAETIMVTHGTAGANMLVYQALVGPGDKVVALTPTYQQHTSIPRSIGAEVVELPLRAEDGYLPDPERLRAAMTGAKVLAFTNPNNPTGALIPPALMEEIVATARAEGAWILSDEVYRGTAQDGDGRSASVADLYEKGISTCGMSKAFSLAGLRLGWVAGPADLLREVELHRDYSTISVSMIDDYFAAMALEVSDLILERSRRITRGNLAMLAEWVDSKPTLDWVRPAAGTTALISYRSDEPSYPLAERMIRETGVMVTPGSVMGMEGALRFGYACAPEVLRAGLDRLTGFFDLSPGGSVGIRDAPEPGART